MDNPKDITVKDRIILDLCGGTGAWSKPYRDGGYDVRLITLPEHDIRLYRSPENVHGILAAPPCTEFSLAKGNQPRDFNGAMEVVRACLDIIWGARTGGPLKWWCMENPRGFLRQFLGVPHFTFEHWQYGSLQIKPTDIWGYFNEPTPTVKERPDLLLTKKFPCGSSNGRGWSQPDCPPEYSDANLSRADLRSITPASFAQAFFEANP